MRPGIADELIDLSPAEKRELAEVLISSAESEASAPTPTETQRAELRARLARIARIPASWALPFKN